MERDRMTEGGRVPVWLALLGLAISAPSVAGPANISTHLEKLSVSLGRWTYHGESIKTPYRQPGKWIWHADCRWSQGRAFLLCGFVNVWSGHKVSSMVLDTYNPDDRAYWHYEVFASGARGNHPYVSRMTIHGNRWMEKGKARIHGKVYLERITYDFFDRRKVSVVIQLSKKGRHRVTIDRGTGIRFS